MKYDEDEEQVILNRLARAHKVWRDDRPPPPPKQRTDERMAQLMKQLENPEPKDVVALREVKDDPVATEIRSQLSIVGWRLYARGGADLLLSNYVIIERDQHPGFAFAVSIAWSDIGLTGDPRGVWTRKLLR